MSNLTSRFQKGAIGVGIVLLVISYGWVAGDGSVVSTTSQLGMMAAGLVISAGLLLGVVVVVGFVATVLGEICQRLIDRFTCPPTVVAALLVPSQMWIVFVFAHQSKLPDDILLIYSTWAITTSVYLLAYASTRSLLPLLFVAIFTMFFTVTGATIPATGTGVMGLICAGLSYKMGLFSKRFSLPTLRLNDQ